ncbi:DUF4843 domain-containing protein [Chitinophaga arvensicola]|uniref:DUF4843 domain-containing protein n=1 Tax=Chitinophaga arvensicola TaxID=29529 RepID=A0A1I0RA12_9BACT|nr:DUF4843 domain-containing protein [Chitinophaga arvensicola]SEW37682.1 protein of unknown function [Chitinophaga arvensicola]
MKTFIYAIAVLLVLAAGCKKADLLIYNDITRVQLSDTTTMSATFVYIPPAITRDTIYIQVNTIGDVADHDRTVELTQVPEYDYTYVRDPVTNQITDTLIKERPFKAVAGVHYLDLKDKSIQSLMVVKAHQAVANIPVVLLRDTSLKNNSYRLRVQLVANDQFGLGEVNARAKTLVFSDRLERFYSWRVDNTSASAFSLFGKYSTGKHQFMVDVLKANIDEEWFQAVLSSGAAQQYRTVLKQALADFNVDPANIASGKAPLRETTAPGALVVTFP